MSRDIDFRRINGTIPRQYRSGSATRVNYHWSIRNDITVARQAKGAALSWVEYEDCAADRPGITADSSGRARGTSRDLPAITRRSSRGRAGRSCAAGRSTRRRSSRDLPAITRRSSSGRAGSRCAAGRTASRRRAGGRPTSGAGRRASGRSTTCGGRRAGGRSTSGAGRAPSRCPS